MLGLRQLVGAKDLRGGRLRRVQDSLRLGELVPALGALARRGRNERVAAGAFLHRRRSAGRVAVAHLQVVDRPVPHDVAAVVEDEAVLLPRREPEAAADHLVVEAWRRGRPQQRHAVDVRRVEAGGEHVHVREVAQLARTKALDAPLPLPGRRIAVDPAAFDAMPIAQDRGDVPTVRNASREDQRAGAGPRFLGDLGARAFDDLVGVEGLLDLARDELAAADLELAHVDLHATGLRPERREEAAVDQRSHAHLVADVVQDSLGRADHPRAHAERRCRETDHAHERVHELRVREELPVHALAVVRRDEVRLVDDHEVDRAELASALPDRLDASDRDRVLELAPAEPRGVDAHAEAGRHRVELADGLLEQLLHVGQDEDAPLPARNGVAADRCDDGRLAAARRDHHERIVFALSEVPVHRLDGGLLVVTEFHVCRSPESRCVPNRHPPPRPAPRAGRRSASRRGTRLPCQPNRASP